MKRKHTINRVLLVSHDPTVRESLGDILRSSGSEVLSAANGLEAVKALAMNAVNVVVLDYLTPFDAEDSLRRRSVTLEALTDIDPFLPLVLTCDQQIDLPHATALMADMVIRHPIAPAALLEAIDTLRSETLRERVYRKSEHFAGLR